MLCFSVRIRELYLLVSTLGFSVSTDTMKTALLEIQRAKTMAFS